MAKNTPDSVRQFLRRQKALKDGIPIEEATVASKPMPESDIVEFRRSEAIRLRREGKSFREIAADLGINVKTAYNYVQDGLIELRESTQMDLESLRDLELDRLDNMLSKVWPAIRQGDVASVMAGLKIIERRAKLLGIDAPEKHVVSPGAVVTPEEASKMSEADLQKRITDLMIKASGVKALGAARE